MVNLDRTTDVILRASAMSFNVIHKMGRAHPRQRAELLLHVLSNVADSARNRQNAHIERWFRGGRW